MRSLAFLILLAASSLPTFAKGEPAANTPLTLDPELYAEALQEAQAGAAKPASAPAAQQTTAPSAHAVPGVEDWQAALRDAGTELADVRLLVLLQRLNPLTPPAARAEDYAEALRLHHLMLAGNARACLQLAAASRAGCFENGLLFIQSASLARVLERRAAVFQLDALPAESAAESERRAEGADAPSGS